MAKHELSPPLRGKPGLAGLVPFGLDRDKPRHFREGLRIVWDNLDSLPYAWRILTQGVCDGCSLGPRGLQDDVLPGLHVCMNRLNLLRNNTVGPFEPEQIADMTRLRRLTNTQLRHLGRVPYPFVYRPGDRGFSRVSWDEALGLIGERLGATPPERQGWFATSKGLTNETYYVFSKAARLLGTNNVDFCARLCHQATVAGLGATLGVGAPTISLSDLLGPDLILLWGTNLANNQPVAVKYLAEAKQRGTRIVVVNTVREKGLEAYWIPSKATSALFGTRLMDDFVQVRAGGDIALMNALLKHLIAWDALDHAFLEAHTEGWEDLVAALEGQSMGDLLAQCGLEAEEVESLARTLAQARSMVTVYSMGLTQHRFGTQNVMGVVNLHLSQGAIGKPFNGILPIRGHSGVQGGGECGVSPGKYPGGLKVTSENARVMAERWGHPVPSGPGLSTGPLIEAAHAGGIDVLYNLGGNLFATMPDPDFVGEAFRRVGLRIHQDINLNTSTLLEPGELTVLLPAQTRYEQRGGGTSTSTERRIRFSPEIPGHPVIGEARPEWEIPCQIAAAARPDLADAFAFADAQDVRDEIGRCMPVYAGIETLRKAGDWIQWGGPQLCVGGDFPTPTGRGRFTPLEPPDVSVPKGWFFLTNRRGKQFNSMVWEDQDAIQGGLTREDVFMAPQDAAELGVAAGDRIRLVNEHGSFEGVVRPMAIKPGHLQAYWPEINVLLPRVWDPISEEPDYNTKVRVEVLG